MAFRSNGGHIAGEDISAYVDEELSPAETSRVHAHLQSCDDCRTLADDMRATQTLVRSTPLVSAPREFTLGPEFDAAPGRQPSYDAPKRHWFNFMPAVALSAAVLMLLVFADLSSLSLGSADDRSAGSGSSAAGRTVQDTAKAAAQEAANAPQPPPVAPRQAQPTAPGSAGGNTQSTQGFGPSPVPQAAGASSAPGTPSILSAPAAIQPSTGSTPAPAIAGGAAQVPTPTNYATIKPADGSSDENDEGGTSVLRILEVITAVVLIGSLAGLYWQRQHNG
jgi:anti-sigma factor RsiW